MSDEGRAVLVEQFKNCLTNSSQEKFDLQANTLSCPVNQKVQLLYGV